MCVCVGGGGGGGVHMYVCMGVCVCVCVCARARALVHVQISFYTIGQQKQFMFHILTEIIHQLLSANLYTNIVCIHFSIIVTLLSHICVYNRKQ